MGLLAVLTIVAASCDRRSAAAKRREIGRIRSPDGSIDAVLEYVTTDPLSADIQELYLVPAGETPKFGRETRVMYVSNLSKPLSLRWRGDSVVAIGFEEAKIQAFTNVWYGPYQGDSTRLVELRLEPAGPRSLPDLFGRRGRTPQS